MALSVGICQLSSVRDTVCFLTHLECFPEGEAPVLHEVGGADRGRSAAAILAVHEGPAAFPVDAFNRIGTPVEVLEEVLGWVVEDGDSQGANPQCREGLLPRHVDAKRHPLSRKEFIITGRPGITDEQ